MLKGISIEKRNHAWHTRNTQRKAKQRVSHLIRSGAYRGGVGRDIVALSKAESKYEKAREREELVFVGLWGRIKLFFTKLFTKFSRRYAKA